MKIAILAILIGVAFAFGRVYERIVEAPPPPRPTLFINVASVEPGRWYWYRAIHCPVGGLYGDVAYAARRGEVK